MEYTPLFGPGFYSVPFGELKESLTKLLVSPFDSFRHRERMLNHLLALLVEVHGVCIFTEAWIDGSFVTDKEEPNDVDVVLWYNAVSSISPRELRTYRELKDSDLMMTHYRCDVYLAKNGNDRLRMYWENWFGKDRTGSPKGIIRVVF
ncbi:MAG: hypothetical protein FWE95_05980 [Planctomycetaceae bacterium]|nr:hypothetical protein [Planctomycetaceae bacterium]